MSGQKGNSVGRQDLALDRHGARPLRSTAHLRTRAPARRQGRLLSKRASPLWHLTNVPNRRSVFVTNEGGGARRPRCMSSCAPSANEGWSRFSPKFTSLSRWEPVNTSSNAGTPGAETGVALVYGVAGGFQGEHGVRPRFRGQGVLRLIHGSRVRRTARPRRQRAPHPARSAR